MSPAEFICLGLNLSPVICYRNLKTHIPAHPCESTPSSKTPQDPEGPGQHENFRWRSEPLQDLKLLFKKALLLLLSHFSVSNSVQPHRRQPTRLPRPWDSPGKNTGVGCHFLLQCMKVKVKSLSCVRLLATSWTTAYQAPLPIEFSRQ